MYIWVEFIIQMTDVESIRFTSLIIMGQARGRGLTTEWRHLLEVASKSGSNILISLGIVTVQGLALQKLVAGILCASAY